MTSDPNERARTLLQEAEDERDAAVQVAIKAGGLPTEDELRKVEDGLQAVFDDLEDLARRVRGIGKSELGEELPFKVSFADIGRVSVLIQEIENRSAEFQGFAREMRATLYALDILRREQS
jgi:hypothetical protein